MGEDRGAFLSFMDELARPGQIVKNLLSGNGTGALHQTEQLGANVLDAFLPGDWLPNDIAKQEDYISGRDLIGAPDDVTGHALGFGIDLLTDPTTYIPASWAAKGIGKAGELASAGVKMADKVLPGTEEAVAGAGRATRDFFGQQRADHPELWNAIDRARGHSADEGRAGLLSTKQALGSLDRRQRTIIGDAIDNVRFGPDGQPIGELIPSGVDPATGMQFGGLKDRIAAHPEVKPEEIEALADAANQITEISRNQKTRQGIFDAESQANLPDEYLARQYNGLKEDPLAAMMGEGGPGLANSLKERKNKDWRDILDTLNANPGSTYERDALARMAKRAGSQADLAKKADVGSAVMDLLRQGKMSLPDEMIAQEAARLRSAALKVPVPESGAYEDVGAMLGGDKASPAVADPYGTALGAGKPKVIEQADVSSMLGGSRTPTADVSGDIEAANAVHTGDQTGKSVVGESLKQPMPKITDFKPEEVEAATKSILGRDFAVSDPQAKAVVRAAIGKLSESGSPETAKMALDAINGIAPRSTLMGLLAKGNSVFKRAATYGLIIPKAGSLVRNRLNALFQTLANPEARGETLNMLKTIPSDLSGAVADALGTNIGKDAVSGTLETWEHALANSKGSAENALREFAKTHPTEAAVIGNGGIDGYVRAEDLVNEAARSPLMRKVNSYMDFPGRIMKGIEDRIRLQLGSSLTKKFVAEGKTLDEAAKEAVRITGDALYRYSSTSAANRAYRDIVPFGAWMSNAVPASAKFLAEKPYVASAWANALSKDPNEDQLYPYLENRVNFDLGKDDQGNRQVIGGFGFPEETLSVLPNPSASLGDFGREVEQNILGQAAPLLKSAYGVVSGHDPTFETPTGSYDKLPVIGHAGEAGRLVNELASTGLLSSAMTPAQIIDKLTDDRRSLPVKLLDSLTGANVVTVDPLKAQAQQLQKAIERNPDIAQIEMPTSRDPDSLALIKELQAVQRKLKQRKK